MGAYAHVNDVEANLSTSNPYLKRVVDYNKQFYASNPSAPDSTKVLNGLVRCIQAAAYESNSGLTIGSDTNTNFRTYIMALYGELYRALGL